MVDGGGGGDGRTPLISRQRASLGEIELARLGLGLVHVLDCLLYELYTSIHLHDSEHFYMRLRGAL